jgi:hypothetical protein
MPKCPQPCHPNPSTACFCAFSVQLPPLFWHNTCWLDTISPMSLDSKIAQVCNRSRSLNPCISTLGLTQAIIPGSLLLALQSSSGSIPRLVIHPSCHRPDISNHDDQPARPPGLATNLRWSLIIHNMRSTARNQQVSTMAHFQPRFLPENNEHPLPSPSEAETGPTGIMHSNDPNGSSEEGTGA